MKSIRASFLKVTESNPDLSSFICFSIAIEGKNFSKESISKSFNRLVKKDDYFDSKIRLLNHLVELSQNHSRTPIHKPNFKS